MLRLVILLIMAGAGVLATGRLALQLNWSGAAAEPPTVAYVDLAMYQGRWYSIANSRGTYWQAACMDRTGVDYTLRTSGGEPVLEVFNNCRGFNGRTLGNRITARVADPDSNAKIYIPAYGGSFQRPNYYIVALGQPGTFGSRPDQYSYAVITDPSGDNNGAYFLVRDPAYATAILQEAAPLAARVGIDLKLQFLEPHEGADFLARGGTRDTTIAGYLATIAPPPSPSLAPEAPCANLPQREAIVPPGTEVD